jgi:hypothetical protein
MGERRVSGVSMLCFLLNFSQARGGGKRGGGVAGINADPKSRVFLSYP